MDLVGLPLMVQWSNPQIKFCTNPGWFFANGRTFWLQKVLNGSSGGGVWGQKFKTQPASEAWQRGGGSTAQNPV